MKMARLDGVDFDNILPENGAEGTWIGKCWVPPDMAYKGIEGPHVIWVDKGVVYDISNHFQTTSQLLNRVNAVQELRNLKNLKRLNEFLTLIKNSYRIQKDLSQPYLLAPNDIQSIKACGVTFIQSLLERVIEEKAGGNPAKANEIRSGISMKIGSDLKSVKPGSSEALILKEQLQKQGIWSQYLEVGIGKDAEVFTKSQPLSAVTGGSQIGILKDSSWNNPEPEVVLAVSNTGEIQGATLGNDVNLRDYEGRSALLLGEAKDQNGSCSIGPMIRLFDETFSLEDVKNEDIRLEIYGADGFELVAESKMSKISREPEALVSQVIGENHQYPDGFMLFCGTMFAPTQDRDKPGDGFTHKPGDRVDISSPKLGRLINWVNTCDAIPRWEYGINELINFLIKRNDG